MHRVVLHFKKPDGRLVNTPQEAREPPKSDLTKSSAIYGLPVLSQLVD